MKKKNTAKTRREVMKVAAVHSERLQLAAEAAPACEESGEKCGEDALDFALLLDQYATPPKDEQSQTRRRGGLIFEINLEEGMPTVEEALWHMKLALEDARRNHYAIARLIHGYGNTGRGGVIGRAVRKALKDAIPGEEFDIFHEETRLLLDRYPELRRDADFGRCNHGITLVILRR